MTRVKKSVKTPAEVAGHAVRVAHVAEIADQRLDLVADAIVIGVAIKADLGDRVSDHAVFVGVDADGDVEVIGEGGDLAGAAGVGVEVFEDLNRVARRLRGGRGERIFAADRHPQPPAGIEREVHGLGNVGLAGDELDVEAVRGVKQIALLVG